MPLFAFVHHFLLFFVGSLLECTFLEILVAKWIFWYSYCGWWYILGNIPQFSMTIQPTQLHLRTTCFFSVCHTVKLTLEEIDSLEGALQMVSFWREFFFVFCFSKRCFFCVFYLIHSTSHLSQWTTQRWAASEKGWTATTGWYMMEFSSSHMVNALLLCAVPRPVTEREAMKLMLDGSKRWNILQNTPFRGLGPNLPFVQYLHASVKNGERNSFCERN